MHHLTKLIKEDMRPALGVTEPGAIAFAVAKAKCYVEGAITKVCVALNSGMYKNAFTCGIPHSDAYGNVHAAALGAVAGQAELELESLRNVDTKANEKAEQFIAAGKIEVLLDHMGSAITIKATVSTEQDICTVYIAGGHTDIYKIVKNDEVIWEAPKKEENESREAIIHHYTLKEILEYVETVPYLDICFIKDAFAMNMDLLKEGLDSPKTIFCSQLLQDNEDKLFSKDVRKSAQLLCNGAIEARVLGLNKPAMSITGSGAHGIIATLPLWAYYQIKKEELEEDKILRATTLSFLITMYIKEYSGKLSAFCGCGIAAGTGMACGLCYLSGGGDKEITGVIQNMASGITGMICDGGNQGCVMKGIVAVDAAFQAVHMAMRGVVIDNMHGINGLTPEDTMRNMGRIASPGMVETEKTIVEIMKNKIETNETVERKHYE